MVKVKVQKKLYDQHGRLDHAKEFGADFRRTADLGSASQIFGTYLIRMSTKLLPTFLFATAAAVGLSVKSDSHSWYQGLFPMLGVPTLFGIGVGLKIVPPFLKFKKIQLAEANDMNLMEDFRKSREDKYLDQLWKRVYSYEADIHYSSEEQETLRNEYTKKRERLTLELTQGLSKETQQFVGIRNDNDLEALVDSQLRTLPDGSHIAAHDLEFVHRAHYALENHLPQIKQLEEIGFCLAGLENYLDGAPLHSTMNKLTQEYANDATLRRIKNTLKAQGEKLGSSWTDKMLQKMWSGLGIQQVAIRVGSALNELNQLYPHTPLNAQVLLWPDAENNSIYEHLEGLSDLIQERRKEMIHQIFGETLEDADRMIDRMILRNLELATQLRLKYDPEYLLNELRLGLREDLESVDCQDTVIEDQVHYLNESRATLNSFDSYLQNTYLLDKELSKEEYRAVRIAFHANYGANKTHNVLRWLNTPGLKDYFHQYQENKDVQIEEHMMSLIDQARENTDIFTNDLIAVRLYQQLTIIEIQETQDLVFTLGDYGKRIIDTY